MFVTGEYNWGMQPGLKNLTDHFLEEWFWRPAAIACYSAGRFAGARAATGVARHALRNGHGGDFEHDRGRARSRRPCRADGKPTGEGGKALEHAFPRFADDLAWWMEAAKAQRQRKTPPY